MERRHSLIDRATASMQRALRDERGVALPLAMVMMVVLAALIVSFAVLARTEPSIASNQKETAQALRLADSGLQLAIWAMNNPGASGGLDYAAMPHDGTAAGGNFDGAHYVSVGGTGGFTVLAQWPATNGTWERTVTTVGWTPSNTTSTNSHRKIQVVVQKGVVPPLDPPCVVCVAGEIQVNGSAADFVSNSNGCPGADPPQYAIQSVQAVQYNAHPTFTGYGTSGGSALNTTNNTSQFKYDAAALAQFKAYAQAHGTYYNGPISSLPTGAGPHVVYIDTTDGSEFTNSTPTSKDGNLSLSGTNTFNGTIIAAGTINISGNTTINGLVYSLNDLSVSGNVTVNGALISENRRDTSSTSIDTDFSGSIAMNFNCTNVRNATINLLGTSWIVKPGAYVETAGS
jgi:Tfp pilus assembly protein PilX